MIFKVKVKVSLAKPVSKGQQMKQSRAPPNKELHKEKHKAAKFVGQQMKQSHAPPNTELSKKKQKETQRKCAYCLTIVC